MGMFGRIGDTARTAARVTKLLAKAADETKAINAATQRSIPELAAAGTPYQPTMDAFHGGQLVQPRGRVDFPGWAAGDELELAPGSEVFGIKGIKGTAKLTEVTASSFRISIDAGVASIRKSLDIHVHQLTDEIVEMQVSGLAPNPKPLVGDILDASTGAISVEARGSSGPVSIATEGADRLRIGFALGGDHAEILVTRAR